MNSEHVSETGLRGRTILITGAGEGLGAAVARRAGAAGAEVILLGRTVRKLETVYDAIIDAGGVDPAIIPLDLEGAGPDDYADIAERIESQCDGLHALIHNAAIAGPLTPLEQYPPMDWMRVLQINLSAPMLLTQACLPLLRAVEDPALIVVGDEPRRAYWGAYGVSKAGLEAWTEALAGEVGSGKKPIGVHWILPGPMRTNFRAHAFPGALPDEAPPPEGVACDRVMEALVEPFAAPSRVMP